MKTQISIDHLAGKRLIRVLALLLLLAVAPMLRAQVADPTGAWLLRWEFTFTAGEGPLVLNVFHQGGTLTGDIQGESAFAPHATTKPKAPLNVITTPFSGVWQKTGFSTFAATFEVIEYEVQTKPPAAPVFRFSKVQYFGTLVSADRMTLHVIVNHYKPDGEVEEAPGEFDATGLRIPVETSPSTGSLPIPGVPPN